MAHENLENRSSKGPSWRSAFAFAALWAFGAAPAGCSAKADADSSPEGSSARGGRIVVLLPLLGGKRIPKSFLQEAAQGISSLYGFEVELAPSRAIPKSAYYRPRRRYRAEKLLKFLEQVDIPHAFRIVGVTAQDISTTKGRYKDWGIMGLAYSPGRVAVVSTFRCLRGARTKAQARHRFAKTVAHELGHTLGLDHCPTRGCIMEDAKGRNDTTDREWILCARCRRILRQKGYRIPDSPIPPWPRPGHHAATRR